MCLDIQWTYKPYVSRSRYCQWITRMILKMFILYDSQCSETKLQKCINSFDNIFNAQNVLEEINQVKIECDWHFHQPSHNYGTSHIHCNELWNLCKILQHNIWTEWRSVEKWSLVSLIDICFYGLLLFWLFTHCWRKNSKYLKRHVFLVSNLTSDNLDKSNGCHHP